MLGERAADAHAAGVLVGSCDTRTEIVGVRKLDSIQGLLASSADPGDIETCASIRSAEEVGAVADYCGGWTGADAIEGK